MCVYIVQNVVTELVAASYRDCGEGVVKTKGIQYYVTCDGDLAGPLAGTLKDDLFGLLEAVYVRIRVDWKRRAEKKTMLSSDRPSTTSRTTLLSSHRHISRSLEIPPEGESSRGGIFETSGKCVRL